MSSPLSGEFGHHGDHDQSPAAGGTGVAEETPLTRSVGLMTLSPHLDAVQVRGTFDAPKLGFSKPAPFGRSSGRAPSLRVRQEWSGVSTASVWNVRPEDLERLSEDFPLERTHREIHNGDALEVSSRISAVMRDLSIEAKYCSKKAKAKCQNSDLVSFVIRLYAGGEGGLPVIVEVQRRSGSARSFMASCRAILAAAEGMPLETSEATKPAGAGPSLMPVSQMRCIPKTGLVSADPHSEAMSALDGALILLRSKQRDTNLLGLENLVSLTDPVKTSTLVSLNAAKCVVLGERNNEIRGEMAVFLQRDSFETSPASDSYDDGEEDGGPVDLEGKLRYLALNVFANALDVCSKDGCLAAAIVEQPWFTECFVPLLVSDLKRASSSSSLAYQAASCMSSLLEASEAVRLPVSRHGGLDALEKAREFGANQHDLLAAEAERCLELLLVTPVA